MSQQSQEQLPSVDKAFHISPVQRGIYAKHQIISKFPIVDFKNKILAPICRVRKKKLPVSGQYGSKIQQTRYQLQVQNLPSVANPTKKVKLIPKYQEQIESKMKSQLKLVKQSITFNQSKIKSRLASDWISDSRERQIISLLASRKKSDVGSQRNERTTIHSNKRVLKEMIIDKLPKYGKDEAKRHNHTSLSILPADSHQYQLKKEELNAGEQDQYIYSSMTSILSSQRAVESIRDSNLNNSNITSTKRRYSTAAADYDDCSEEDATFRKEHLYLFEYFRERLYKKQRVSFLQKIINRKGNYNI